MQEKSIVAKVFIFNSEGQILTLLRSQTVKNRPGTWDLPGGTVEFGEDPTDAVIRETKEEANIDLKNVQVFITKTTNEEKYVIRVLYYAHLDNPDISLSHEHDEYKWVTKDEFKDLNIPTKYKDCLQFFTKLEEQLL
jgi:8-oxo-dGTP diphosphatase